MMKRIFAVIGIAVSLMLTVGSCTKELGSNADHSSSIIKLTVTASLPDFYGVTKSSLVNNNTASWTAGDIVYVYDNAKCLGTLTAALKGANDKYAVLSGTITSSRASMLTLVATKGLTPDVKTQDTSITSGVTFDLSSQNMDKDQTPYVVYAVIDNPSGTGVSDIKTSFSFATSVINVNCTALKEGTAVNNVKIYNVNTVMTITPKADDAPAITSGTEGTITRTGAEGGELGISNDEGVLIFTVAVPEQDATKEDRKIHVSQSGWPSSASLTNKPLTKGTSYNTVCQLSGPYKTIGGHSGVRLWADGPYWATCNIGAESPADIGYYFMWGSTQGYEHRGDSYDYMYYYNFYKPGTSEDKVTREDFSSIYEFGNSTIGFTKYNDSDKKTQLEPIDDAAAIYWGSGWRMPTDTDLNGLYYKCELSCKTTTPQGYLVTGKGDYACVSVFLPAAGYTYGGNNVYGYYWTSSLQPADPENGIIPYYLRFDCEQKTFSIFGYAYPRYHVFQIRPVID